MTRLRNLVLRWLKTVIPVQTPDEVAAVELVAEMICSMGDPVAIERALDREELSVWQRNSLEGLQSAAREELLAVLA